MKYLITESQLKLISELERNWRDFEYEEQYHKIKGRIIPYIIDMISSYNDDNYDIDFYDSEGNVIMRWYKNSLYYDYSLDDFLGEMLPHPLWFVHGKYIMSDVFKHFYPDLEVKSVQGAHVI